jgi:hypothetical protein
LELLSGDVPAAVAEIDEFLLMIHPLIGADAAASGALIATYRPE